MIGEQVLVSLQTLFQVWLAFDRVENHVALAVQLVDQPLAAEVCPTDRLFVPTK